MTFNDFLQTSGISKVNLDIIVNIDNVIHSQEAIDFLLLESDIDGIGLFSQKDYKAGEVLGNASIDSSRTVMGRYINHSDTPNCKLNIVEMGIRSEVISLIDIYNGDELTMCYMDNILQQKELLNEVTRPDLNG